jgi:two-component system sensor histidine kinase TctE
VKIFQREQPSLFGGILDWMLIPLLLLWPISLGLMWLVAVGVSNKPYDRGLEHQIQIVERLLADQKEAVDQRLRSVEQYLSKKKTDDSERQFFQLRAYSGALIAGEAGLATPQDDDAFLKSDIRFRDEQLRGQKVRVAHLWFKANLEQSLVSGDSSPSNAGYLLQVTESYEKRGLLAQEIVKGVMLPQLAILPLGILVLWIALARGLQPLRRLEEHIRQRRTDDLSPLDYRVMPIEVTPLVASINELLSRLKSSIETKKRFLADAAHQLKTPLAGLRMQSELAQTESLSNTELKHTLRLIGLSSVRATRVVNQLLSLARAEVGAQSMTKVNCDLGELVEEVLQETWQLASQKYLDLGYESSGIDRGASKLELNPILIKEMIRNLLENAINYTPSDLNNPGVINLSIHLNDEKTQLTLVIEDSGPGISDTEKELVIQPFYRSLGVAGQVDGSGLGLSIVKEIADQHQARVYLEDAQSDWPEADVSSKRRSSQEASKLRGLRVRVVFECLAKDA